MKKHPILIAILSVLVLVCVVGITYTILAVLDGGKTQKTIDKNAKELKSLVERKNNFALSDENVKLAANNLEMLRKALGRKIAAMIEPKLILSKFNSTDSAALVGELKTYQQNNAERCAKSGVVVSENAGFFGFSRYLANSNEIVPAESCREIDVEARAIGIILENLLDANEKHEKAMHDANVIPPAQKVYLRVNAIRREAFELVGEKRRSLSKDEFVVIPDESVMTTGLVTWKDGLGREGTYISLQRSNITRAISIQIEFVGDSAVLRELLESLKDYSLYVRDIQASRATQDMLPAKASSEPTGTPSPASADPFDFFGAVAETNTPTAPAQRARARIIVEDGQPDVFTVTFEYVAPAGRKEEPKSETK